LLLSAAAIVAVLLAMASAPAQAAIHRPATAATQLGNSSGPATAAADPVNCLSGWHFLNAAAVNRWLQPDGAGLLWANGNRSIAPWNQEFLMCQSPTWVSPDHPKFWWAFYSNVTNHWIRKVSDGTQVDANGGQAADAESEWHVCNYDNNFVLISWTGSSNYLGATVVNGPVYADTSVPGGNQLFTIDPKVLTNIEHC
jgi:hypothetical protein